MNRNVTGWRIGAALAVWLGTVPAAHAATAATGLALAGTARSLGMGGAGAAMGADAGSIWLNPGHLGWLTTPEMAFLHGQYVAEIAVDQLSFALPAPYGGAAIGVARASMGTLDSYNAVGTNIGTFSPGDLSVTAAYGYGAKLWAAGLAVGWARSELTTDARASAWSGDVGGCVRPMPMLTIGAAVQRVGGSLTFDTEAADLPLTIRGGAALAVPGLPITVALDAVQSGDDELSIRGGLEGSREVKPGLDARVRAGYRTGTPAGGVSGLAAGAAVTWRPEAGFFDRDFAVLEDPSEHSFWLAAVRIEYAWTPMGDLGNAHWFSLGLLF